MLNGDLVLAVEVLPSRNKNFKKNVLTKESPTIRLTMTATVLRTNPYIQWLYVPHTIRPVAICYTRNVSHGDMGSWFVEPSQPARRPPQNENSRGLPAAVRRKYGDRLRGPRAPAGNAMPRVFAGSGRCLWGLPRSCRPALSGLRRLAPSWIPARYKSPKGLQSPRRPRPRGMRFPRLACAGENAGVQNRPSADGKIH